MKDQPLRIVFAGTPGFAAEHLKGLLAAHHHVVGVFTQPDRPTGRGKKIQPTPVKAVAQQHAIPVFQPQKLDEAACSDLAALQPDVMIVVAYGLILSQAVLDIPRLGCVNVHASLLPRWRGAAPVERAILAGDSETGVSLMQMDAGLDTGDVLLELPTPIKIHDNAQTITERLISLGIEGLNRLLPDLANYQARAVVQDDASTTYAAKLTKAESQIDWHQPASQVHRQVQAFFPRSPAWCYLGDDRLRLIAALPEPFAGQAEAGTIISLRPDSMSVACGENALKILKVQLPGKKPLALRDIFNGNPGLFFTGDSLAAPDGA